MLIGGSLVEIAFGFRSLQRQKRAEAIEIQKRRRR